MIAKTEPELKEKFWNALSSSPIVMLELDDTPHSASPMTAQLDKEAHHAIWFFTARESAVSRMGPATAMFSAKDHKLFARFAGRLVEEKDPALKDRHWSNAVAAWFPEGKNSARLLFLRMDLGEASIWSGEMSVLEVGKMLLGMNVRDEVKGQHARTKL